MDILLNKEGNSNIRLIILAFVVLSGIATALLYFPPIPTMTKPEKTSGDITFLDNAGNPLSGAIELSGAEGISSGIKPNVSFINWTNVPNARILYNALDTKGVSVNLQIAGDSRKGKVILENYGINMPADMDAPAPGTPIKYVEINASGVSFVDADISIQYTDGELNGLDEKSLAIYHYDASSQTWSELPTGINATNNILNITVNSLSIFAVSTKIPEKIEVHDTNNKPVAGDIKIYDEAKTLKKQAKTSTLSTEGIPERGELEVDALASKDVAVKLKVNKASKGEIILDDFGKSSPVSVQPPGKIVKYAEIEAKNISFSSANITIRYSDAELNGGNGNGLIIYHWNGTSWEALPTEIDTANKILRATSSSLSPFGVSTNSVYSLENNATIQSVGADGNTDYNASGTLVTLIPYKNLLKSGAMGVQENISYAINTSNNEYEIFRFYLPFSYPADTQISANATANISWKAASTSDIVNVSLIDYNPINGIKTTIGSTGFTATGGATTTVYPVTISNPQYAVRAGNRLITQINTTARATGAVGLTFNDESSNITITETALGIAAQPNITSWSNNKTNDQSSSILIYTNDSVRFNATANQTITTWNWYKNGINQNNNYDYFTAFWDTAGTKTVEVNATNANGTSNTVMWTVTVAESQIYAPPVPAGLTSAQGNFWINNTWQAGAGNKTDSYNVSINGIWTNGTTATYYNSTVGAHGWSNISVYAYNNSGSGSLSQIPASQNTQVANNIPIQAPIGNKTVSEGQLLTFTVNAIDADSDIITYGTNATKGTLNTTTGNYSWIPNYGDAGFYFWDFNSSDGYGGIANESIAVTVINVPLSVTNSSPAGDPTTAVNTAQMFGIALNRTANVTWYINGSLVQTNSSVISANYTNSAASAGGYNVTAIANDSYYSASRTWNWTVTPQPTYNVSGYVFDNYGSGLGGVLVQNGSNQSTTLASGYYLVTGLFNGIYNFSYSKPGFNTGYLGITVNDADNTSANTTIYDTTPPASVSNTTSATGNFYTNNTWTNPADADFNYTWFRYSNGTNLQNISSLVSYLNLTWSPHYAQNISVQTVDTYGNINRTKVWFNVTIPNNPPVQLPVGNQNVTAGSLLQFNVTATDADSDQVTYGTNATNGILNATTGAYSWQTSSSDAGTYIWYFNSSDSYGGVTSETITVTVEAAPPSKYIPPAPSNLTSTQGNFWINNSWQAGAGNATDSYNISVNGSWINGTTNTYYNHTVGPHGWSNITVWAFNNSDGGSLSSAPVSQGTQVANNAPLQIAIGNKVMNEGDLLAFTVSATDTDNDTVTYGTNATKGSFNTTTGNFSWTPSYGDAGVYIWHFNSSDNYGGVASETITLTVDNVPLSITSSSPVGDPATMAGTAQIFGIALNRTANATWYIDGSAVQTNSSITSANYTNSTAGIGTYSVTVAATDGYDSISKRWNWTVISQPVYSPGIISWSNSKTNNNSLTLAVNTSEKVNFNAAANQTITTWNWYQDGVNQSNNYDNLTTSWNTSGTKSIQLNAANSNGTSNTITWTVTVLAQPATYIPPSPASINSTAGSFWVNTTWQLGAGNATDSYNVSVNGAWTNGTTNTSVNSSLSAHAWQNVTVYAYNASGSGSLSASPATKNTQIPNNPPVQYPIGNKTVYEGQWLSFTVNATDADNDTITYGTNATKGSFNTATGNFSWLTTYSDAGTYVWYFHSSDGYGGIASETITVTVNNTPLSVNSFLPLSDPTTIQGTAQIFNITLNRTANVTWYMNGTQVQMNTSTASASYTNSTAAAGIWNVTANAVDGVDTISRTWNWTVNAQPPATYIPPNPINLQNTTGNFWINHTWQAGSGNATDLYDISVNGTWYNGTIDTYYNSTVGPHGWSNITVWAYNSSGALSAGSVSQNTQVPNDPPIQAQIGNQNVTTGNLLTFTVSATDADNDTITYGTNATKGTLNTSTGIYSWTPTGSDVRTYTWYFNSSDNYGGVATETITVTVNLQAYNLSGYVENASSGAPLSGATVQINTSLPPVTTNATGAYNFTGLANGTYLINSSLAGYITNSTTATINGADVTNANISLSAAEVNLINISASSSTTTPGKNATYVLNLTNNGTATDTYTITVSNPDSASTAATNITQAMLAAGASKIFALNVTNTAEGTFRVNVAATSGNDPTKFGYINTTTTVAQTQTYISPSPVNLASTQGNFWINYTWQPGSGNVTNSYNVSVNGTWYNGSSNIYNNNSIGPRGWSNISVYSYNNSGAGMLNITPVSGNTQVANNPVTIGNVSGSYTLTAGDMLSIYPTSSDLDGDTPTFARNFTKGTFYTNNGTLLWTTTSSDIGSHYWQINVTDGYDSVSSANLTVTVNAAVVAGVNLTNISALSITNTPGKNATYILNLTNNGTATDTYTITVSNPDNASTAATNITQATLAAGAIELFALNVTNTAAGAFMVNVTANSTNDPTKFGYINTTTTVMAGGPNCIQCHNLATGLSGDAPVGINFTAVNLSVHFGINSQNATNQGYAPVVGACWACHDTDGNVTSGHPDMYKMPKTCVDCHLENGAYYNQSVSWGLNVTVSEHYYGGDQIAAGNSSSNISSCFNCHENVSEMLLYNNVTDNYYDFSGNYGVGGNQSFFHYGKNRSDLRSRDSGMSENCSYCHQNTSTAFIGAMVDPNWNASIANHSTNYNSTNPGCTNPTCHNTGWIHNSTLNKPVSSDTLCKTCHGTGGSASKNNKSEHKNLYCTECHANSTNGALAGKDIHPIKYLLQNNAFSTSNSSAVDCTTCHQSTSVDSSLVGFAPPKIVNPLHHSDNPSNGSIWNGTQPGYWINTMPQTACIYCHSDTKHSATPLGRFLQWEPNYVLYGSISTNTSCADCHYKGDSSYAQMNSTFTSAALTIPPEITNGTNWNGVSSFYYNHTLSGYNDQTCKTCHGTNLGTGANMGEFLHDVTKGGDCKGCHFDFTFMNSSGAPASYVNSTMYNASTHGSLNCEDCHTKGHNNIAARKACEDCHAVQTIPITDRDRHNIAATPSTYLYNGTSVVKITDCTICHNPNQYANATTLYGLPPKAHNCDYCHTYPTTIYP